MYFVGHIASSFVSWPISLVVMDGDQQLRKYAPKNLTTKNANDTTTGA